MTTVILRLKSGREFKFKCEEYQLHTLKLDGRLCDFKFENAVGEFPIWFMPEDIEVIAVVNKKRQDCW